MIRLEAVSKSFLANGSAHKVLDAVNISLPAGRSIALLGRNGTGKSTLLKIISGVMQPDQGRVLRQGTISWPIGFAGSFHPDLTGAQNARFVARIYGVDTADLLAYVADFAELGNFFHMPFRTYSSGMRSRLAFGVSMAIRFDTYLVDEVTSVGDAAFRRKCDLVFADRLQNSGAIVVSHSMAMIERLCDCAIVMERGKLRFFDRISPAIAAHSRQMALPGPLSAA